MPVTPVEGFWSSKSTDVIIIQSDVRLQSVDSDILCPRKYLWFARASILLTSVVLYELSMYFDGISDSQS